MLKIPQGQLLYWLLESSHFILCVCLDETPLEPIWTFELWGSGHFECFLFGTAVWLAETVIKIFGCQSKRNGLALWWAIIRKRSWREKKTLNARVWWKNVFLFLFWTEEAYSHGDLQTRELGQMKWIGIVVSNHSKEKLERKKNFEC